MESSVKWNEVLSRSGGVAYVSEANAVSFLPPSVRCGGQKALKHSYVLFS